MKSMRATFVVAPAVTVKVMLLSSLEVIISEGEQSATPPLLGTVAMASTVKGTLPVAGTEYVNPDDANTPTLGLLPGTTSV